MSISNLKKFIKIRPSKNILIWLTYIIALPVARAALLLRISPNKITSFSSIFALLSGLELIFFENKIAFAILFTISYILDFVDGLVARASGKVGNSHFDYDHVSDLFKISFIVLCIATQSDSKIIWIASSISMSLFLISTILNHDLSLIVKNKNEACGERKIKNWRENVIVVNIYSIFFTYDSHTLLLFLVMILNPNWIAYIFYYLIAVSLNSCIRFIQILRSEKL